MLLGAGWGGRGTPVFPHAAARAPVCPVKPLCPLHRIPEDPGAGRMFLLSVHRGWSLQPLCLLAAVGMASVTVKRPWGCEID